VLQGCEEGGGVRDSQGADAVPGQCRPGPGDITYILGKLKTAQGPQTYLRICSCTTVN